MMTSIERTKLVAVLTAVNERCEVLYQESHRAYLKAACIGQWGRIIHPVRFKRLLLLQADKVAAFHAMNEWRDELTNALESLMETERKEDEDLIRKYMHEERN